MMARNVGRGRASTPGERPATYFALAAAICGAATEGGLRGIRAARAVAIVAALLAFGAAACSSDDDPGVTPSSTPAASGTRVVLPTVAVSGNTVNSSAWQYKATLPDGWHVSSNFIQSGTAEGGGTSPFGGDALFAPAEENKDPANPVQANIAIVCEETGITDLNEYVTQKANLQGTLKRENIVVSDHADVAGVPAKQLEYNFKRDDLAFEKVEVFFFSPLCARTVSLTTQPGERDRLRPQLDQVLSSIEAQ
jgi:hypothetical protein